MRLRVSRAAQANFTLTLICALPALSTRELQGFPDVVSFGDSKLQDAVLGSAHYLEEDSSGSLILHATSSADFLSLHFPCCISLTISTISWQDLRVMRRSSQPEQPPFNRVPRESRSVRLRAS